MSGSGRYPAMGSEERTIIELLELIASNTGGPGVGDVTVGGDSYEIEQGLRDPEDTDPVYATTGSGGVLVDHYEWDDVSLGFDATTINVRFTEPIVVAFRDPFDRESWQIPLWEEDSPFTIGDGSAPIGASDVWLKKMEIPEPENWDEEEDGEWTTPDPIVHIIAKR